jgi:hypothetical protein
VKGGLDLKTRIDKQGIFKAAKGGGTSSGNASLL